MDTLTLISSATKTLASCRDLREIRDIRNKAEAVRQYLKASGESLQAQNHAAEIRLRAERRAGELLAEALPHNGGRPSGKPSQAASVFPSLDELGLNFSQSSRYQLEASVAEEVFESWVTSVAGHERELTQAGLLKLARSMNGNGHEDSQVALQAYGVVTDLNDLVLRGAKFGCIYADPPWAYSNNATRSAVGGKSRAAYKSTMTLDEICAEPVAQIAADQSHLHLWTTNGFLFDAKLVIEAWGYTYKSCFVWVKPQLGIGNYWRVSHEFLLLGIRGGLTFKDRSLRSWLEADRVGHSVKPAAVRNLVMKASPGPYLELYGREMPDTDWTVYGNEIRKSLL